MKNLKPLLLSSLLAATLSGTLRADPMDGTSYVLTKDVIGAMGQATATSADFTLAFAWGQPTSGESSTDAPYTMISGYFSGGFGNGLPFTIISSQIGNPREAMYTQNHLPVVGPQGSPVTIMLSDQWDASTTESSIQAIAMKDHLGLSANNSCPVTITADPANATVTIFPQGVWSGNTLYDVQLSPRLLNVDGVPLDKTYHLYFQTMLDPREDNVVQDAGLSSLYLPSHSLPDYAVVLFNNDPPSNPTRVNPDILREANAKALSAGGAYRVPIAIREITAYDTQGKVIGALSAPAEVTLHYAGSAAALVRPQTLALWVLDEAHHMWVKIPASQNAQSPGAVRAPASRLSAFALMGSADGSAQEAYAFPVPWRPHGPQAGTGAGQSGTEAAGITFSNLPSECRIKIFTISGDLVRALSHSDAAGPFAQETWDARTAGGEAVASGVYLWRVESSVDSKNGKLMVIR